MTFLRAPFILTILAAVFGGVLINTGDAYAQAAHDTRLLSDAERKHYNTLLSKANDSAARAKVKSEMNRLIQTRRLEQRKKKRQK